MNHNPYATPQSRFEGSIEPAGRKRWVAVILGLVAPPVAMLYVVRPWRAAAYLAASVLGLPLSVFLGMKGLVDPGIFAPLVSVALSLAAAADGYRLAASWTGTRLPWYSRTPALAAVLAAGWLSILSLRAFVAEPFRIPSASMQPTLQVGDHILVRKTAYGWNEPFTGKRILRFAGPQRGDVAVFRYPPDPHLNYVMRVVGLPGDTVAYQDKRLSLNGKEQPMREVGPETIVDSQGTGYTLTRYHETLDHVTHSILLDPSAPPYLRNFALKFHGQENCRQRDAGLECTVPANHYFVMGDNRDNASDSRYWGFVPEENFVGRAFLVWFSTRDSNRAGTAIQ